MIVHLAAMILASGSTVINKAPLIDDTSFAFCVVRDFTSKNAYYSTIFQADRDKDFSPNFAAYISGNYRGASGATNTGGFAAGTGCYRNGDQYNSSTDLRNYEFSDQLNHFKIVETPWKPDDVTTSAPSQ